MQNILLLCLSLVTAAACKTPDEGADQAQVLSSNNAPDVKVVLTDDMPLLELSGLAMNPRGTQIVGVGDKSFEVAFAELAADSSSFKFPKPRNIKKLIPKANK